MLTKKEKLLIYPWQMKRFHQHRQKVQSAGPAIDFYPPNDYPHITEKLKKVQKESERQDKVNKDNIRLLQRLGSIMTTKRLKNFWDTPRPSFLSREFIPHLNSRSSQTDVSDDETQVNDSQPMKRKSRCLICSGKFRRPNKIIPQERIPWKLSTPTRNMKLLKEADIKPHKCCKYCC
ncbi:CLUMA_CG008032, isoform A [Clunio marinus]|uniref:CLUMA_CG008032, isoform A n=1 Tax=Clunio marinus TaxID=568069 RepID=A0A1J1I7Z8_9DIPT|nr:CLUMA_CG008032, isoform A [Clunio marinus]